MKATNKRLKLSVLSIALIVVMMTVLVGCKANDDDVNVNSTNDTENVEMVTDENGEQYASEEDAGTPIETKYADLVMPADLEKELTVEKAKEGGVEKLVFSAEISDEKLELFTILMSEEEQEGYKMGTLKDDKGDIIVTIQIKEQREKDWNEDEYNKITSLQERVNDFIYQISKDERFVPGK